MNETTVLEDRAIADAIKRRLAAAAMAHRCRERQALVRDCRNLLAIRVTDAETQLRKMA